MSKILMMKNTLFSVFFVALSSIALAQSVSDCHKEGGAFISEVANRGKADYIELTVYGSTSNPTAPVNLEGWILDDNNISQKNVGNQQGHIRLGSCFAAVKPGTIILIYTPLYYDGVIKKAKDGFHDYNIQTSIECLVPYLNCPDRRVKDTGYDCLPTIYSPITFWDLKELIPLYNAGDALQLRNKEGELEHAIYWTNVYEEKDNPKAVDITSKIPIPSVGNFTVNRLSIHFTSDKDWFNPNNYEVNNVFTLGKPNNDDFHEKMIEKLKNGSYSTALKATVTMKQQPTSKNNDGVIEVNISGGQGKYKISVNSDDYNDWEFFDATGTYEFDKLPEGDYTVLIEDGEFCPVFTDINLEKSEAECAGTCKDIGVNPQQYCKYEWNQHADIVDVTQATIKVCPNETTTYTLRVMDGKGNIKELKYTVEVKEAVIEPSPVLFCGGKRIITVEGQNPVWLHNNATTNAVDIDELGTYKVQITDKTGCRINGKVEVLDATDPDAIKKYFEARGFTAVTQNVRIVSVAGKSNGTDSSALSRAAPCSQMFGNDQLFINNQFLNLEELAADICYYEPDFADSHIITDNESFCKNGNLDLIEQTYASNDKAIWYHLYKNGTENILFYKQSKPKEKKNKCSLDNLKNVFKSYNGKGKYKMLFVLPDLDNKTYIEVATLKNDWLFGVVIVEDANKKVVTDAFNNSSFSQQEKEEKMRYGNKTYNINSIECFYQDNRPSDLYANKKGEYPYFITKSKMYHETATPLYENNATFLISISELQTNYPNGERVLSTKGTEGFDYNNDFPDRDIILKKSGFISWLHCHPNGSLRKKIDQLINVMNDIIIYDFTEKPSQTDTDWYKTSSSSSLNIYVDNIGYGFFPHDKTGNSRFFRVERQKISIK